MPPDVFNLNIRADDLRIAARGRRSFWLATLVLVGLVALLGVASYAGWNRTAESYVPPQFGQGLAFVLALVPALVWLTAFALFEGRNPTARRATFLLWIITSVLFFVTINPLLAYVFHITDWLFVTWWSNLLGKWLIIAPMEMFLLYLVLRFGVYPGNTMRTLTDGPLYGMAAALGMATAVGLQAVISVAFVSLSMEAVQIGEFALTYAALGAWMGYFLTVARFKRTSVFYLAAGVMATILLHGLIFFALNLVHAQARFLFDLNGLMLSFLFMAGTLVFLFWRLRKHGKDFIRIAALVEIQEERATPKSVLADVVQMVESNELEPRPVPQPPTHDEPVRADGDELASLKQSWESLIAEQEADHD